MNSAAFDQKAVSNLPPSHKGGFFKYQKLRPLRLAPIAVSGSSAGLPRPFVGFKGDRTALLPLPGCFSLADDGQRFHLEVSIFVCSSLKAFPTSSHVRSGQL